MPRRKFDFYPTPETATLALLDVMGDRAFGVRMYEPCAGDGAIANVLRRHNTVLTGDIDENHSVDFHGDARTEWPYGRLPRPGEDSLMGARVVDYVITNPPFNCAMPMLKFWYDLYQKSVIDRAIWLLLRLSFLEPVEERAEFLAEYPPSQIVVLPRISFTGDGKTDSVTCAWMKWTAPVSIKDIRVYTKQNLRDLALNSKHAAPKTGEDGRARNRALCM